MTTKKSAKNVQPMFYTKQAIFKALDRAKELSEDQRSIVATAVEKHQHDRYTIDITLHLGDRLKGFVVLPNVMRPELMMSIWLARYLHANSMEFWRKECLDMGCGSGIQGIVMAKYGASSVLLADFSPAAVANAKENIRIQHLSGKCDVVHSDLFAKVPAAFDLIVFNHPTFGDSPIDEFPITRAMMDTGGLIRRFLAEASGHLKPGGKLIMSFFHPASQINNPELVGPELGYTVKDRFSVDVTVGLQQGMTSVYELTREN